MGKKVIDYDTGEIIDNVSRIVTNGEQKKITEYKKLQQRRKDLRKLINKHCGAFYFYRYDRIIELLNDDTSTAFRFLYLCACANTEGYFIKYGNEYCKTIEDFTYIFDKGRSSVKKYMKNIIDYKLVYKDTLGYRINPIYYSMGGMDDDFKRQSVRTFNQAIKELYYNSDPKEHSLMGQLIKLVPYINIYSNTICENIDCIDKKEIQPLTKTEIANILQANNTYGYTLLDKLMNVFIKGEPVIGLFTSMGQYQYRVNPRLFYRGNNPWELRDLIDLFDIAKNQFIRKKKMAKEEIK
jgi:predicted transcriptional regulator